MTNTHTYNAPTDRLETLQNLAIAIGRVEVTTIPRGPTTRRLADLTAYCRGCDTYGDLFRCGGSAA